MCSSDFRQGSAFKSDGPKVPEESRASYTPSSQQIQQGFQACYPSQLSLWFLRDDPQIHTIHLEKGLIGETSFNFGIIIKLPVRFEVSLVQLVVAPDWGRLGPEAMGIETSRGTFVPQLA